MKRDKIWVLIAYGFIMLQLSACGGNKEEGDMGNAAVEEVVNPMVEVKDVEEMQDKLSFMVLTLPEYYNSEENTKYFIVDKEMAEIQYTVGEHEVEIRQQKGEGDITGIYGESYQDAEYEDITYHYCVGDDFCAAWWENSGYAYSVMATDITEEEFISEYVEVLVDQSIFNLEYEKDKVK